MLGAINLRKLITSLIPSVLTGFLGWLFTRSSMDIYGELIMPPLSPPGVLFPIVWTVLYVLMGVALYLVRSTSGDEEVKSKGYTLYAVQLIFNFLWTIVIFNLRWFGFSAIWLVALIILIGLNIVYFGKINKNAGLLLVPYLLWCVFALYLNIGIWILN